jgi:predicted HTH transcriptional regulator
MKRSPFDTVTLEEIFKFDSENNERLSSRESGKLEFKEAFHFGSADDYAKTMAAFANASGGYLVYGVKDKPRTLMGLKSDAFDSLDPAKLTQTLNSILAPEIHWDTITHEVNGKKIGIIYIHEAVAKPVLCLKTTKEVQEGAIYYRYRGRSEKIRYSELRQLLDVERQKERELWAHTLQRMARIGIENVGILNSK